MRHSAFVIFAVLLSYSSVSLSEGDISNEEPTQPALDNDDDDFFNGWMNNGANVYVMGGNPMVIPYEDEQDLLSDKNSKFPFSNIGQLTDQLFGKNPLQHLYRLRPDVSLLNKPALNGAEGQGQIPTGNSIVTPDGSSGISSFLNLLKGNFKISQISSNPNDQPTGIVSSLLSQIFGQSQNVNKMIDDGKGAKDLVDSLDKTISDGAVKEVTEGQGSANLLGDVANVALNALSGNKPGAAGGIDLLGKLAGSEGNTNDQGLLGNVISKVGSTVGELLGGGSGGSPDILGAITNSLSTITGEPSHGPGGSADKKPDLIPEVSNEASGSREADKSGNNKPQQDDESSRDVNSDTGVKEAARSGVGDEADAESSSDVDQHQKEITPETSDEEAATSAHDSPLESAAVQEGTEE